MAFLSSIDIVRFVVVSFKLEVEAVSLTRDGTYGVAQIGESVLAAVWIMVELTEERKWDGLVDGSVVAPVASPYV